MPILGVIDSGKSGNLYFASFDSIATQTVGAGGSTGITFSSIPSGYTHLQLRGIGRTARATYANDGLKLQFNSDAGNNYSRHQLAGDSSGSFDTGSAANSNFMFSQIAGNGAIASDFGSFVIDIFDYANTSKNKTVRFLSGIDNNSLANTQSGYISFASGAWYNTAAITSLTLFGFSGNLLQNTSIALYGIKVA